MWAFNHLIFFDKMQGSELFTQDGLQKTSNGSVWKGEEGLYTVGFSKRGLLGTASDALNIARDIADQLKKFEDCKNSCSSVAIL